MCCRQASWAQVQTFIASRLELNPSGRTLSVLMVENGLPLQIAVVVVVEKAHWTYSGSILYCTWSFYVFGSYRPWNMFSLLSNVVVVILLSTCVILRERKDNVGSSFLTQFNDACCLHGFCILVSLLSCLERNVWKDLCCCSGYLYFCLLFYAVEILSFWLKLLAMIGEQFDEGDEICGAVVSVRRQDKIAIWTKTASNEAAQV